MTTRRQPARSTFPTPPSIAQSRPLRVDPFAPLPTSSPLSQPAGESASWPEEVQMNSVPTGPPVARTTSRKRRVSGTGSGNGKSHLEKHSQPPAAPEVPRAPPVSYRGPYSSNGTSPTIGNPTSFAARARGFAEEQDIVSAEASPELAPVAQAPFKNRRRSVDRAAKEANAEPLDQRLEPASSQLPTTNGGVRIQQSMSAKVPRQRQAVEAVDSRLETAAPTSESHGRSPAGPVRSSTRRSSAGAADPRKEWASDRSPLQKLEVKLNDISKEEKRARVEKAERRMREKQAEKESRQKDQSLHSGLDHEQIGGLAGREKSESKLPLPERVSQPNTQKTEKSPKDRPVAPAYFEDIDQEKLERQQLPSSQKATTVSARSAPQGSAQRSLAAPADKPVPQQQTGRGVRFQNADHSEQGISDVAQQDTQEPIQPQDRTIVGTQGKRLQQRTRDRELAKGAEHSKEVPTQQQALYGSKAQRSGKSDDPATYGGAPDPVPGSSVRSRNHAIKYEVPPQTAAGIEARQKVGFGGDPAGALPAPAQRHKHRFSKILQHDHEAVPSQKSAVETQPKHIDEWRQGGTARLTAADFVSGSEDRKEQKAWWEAGKPKSQGETSAKLAGTVSDQTWLDGSYPDNYGTYLYRLRSRLVESCASLPTTIAGIHVSCQNTNVAQAQKGGLSILHYISNVGPCYDTQV